MRRWRHCGADIISMTRTCGYDPRPSVTRPLLFTSLPFLLWLQFNAVTCGAGTSVDIGIGLAQIRKIDLPRIAWWTVSVLDPFLTWTGFAPSLYKLGMDGSAWPLRRTWSTRTTCEKNNILRSQGLPRRYRTDQITTATACRKFFDWFSDLPNHRNVLIWPRNRLQLIYEPAHASESFTLIRFISGQWRG